MKYLYSAGIAFLLFAFIYNHQYYEKLNNTFEKYNEKYVKTNRDIDTLIYSLLNFSTRFINSECIHINDGNVFNLFDIREKTLVYFYTMNECFPCIEKNLFRLFNLSNSNFNILIVCNESDKKYSTRLSRSHSNNKLKFCYLKDQSINKSEFFYINSNGRISNSFYPDNNNEITEKYLQFVLRKYE